jgi:hypothetical protein
VLTKQRPSSSSRARHFRTAPADDGRGLRSPLVLIYLASRQPGLLAHLIDSGHDIACCELLDFSTMPTEWTDREKVSAIIASVDEEIAVARKADVIGYAGDLAPGIQVLARMAGKPLQAL